MKRAMRMPSSPPSISTFTRYFCGSVYHIVVLVQHRHVVCRQKLGALSFLKKYLLQRCPEAQQPILQAAFDQAGSKQLGLLLNERMVNTPYQLAPVLHSALVQDLDWAVENEVGTSADVASHVQLPDPGSLLLADFGGAPQIVPVLTLLAASALLF